MTASVYLVGQTAGKVFSTTYCARQAAILGPIPAAAYSLTHQIGFYISILCNSMTIAVQTLLSREIASSTKIPKKTSLQQIQRDDNMHSSRDILNVAKSSIMTSAFITSCISIALFLGKDLVLTGMTNSQVIHEAAVNIFPIFILTQGKRFP